MIIGRNEYRRLIMPSAARVSDMYTCPMQMQGTLDDKDSARVEGIDPGTCKINFPELNKDVWEKI